ncbi:hypothetical protein V6X63_03350 [Spiribacter sp. 221]|uniref:hypothetical protein n=1 Tax=Spiribacter onubensis TaxID=3122420 RepID=UPI00349F0D5F
MRLNDAPARGLRARAHQQQHAPDAQRLIASDEVLGSRSRLETRPIVRLLRVLNEAVWREGAVRAVIVFRNLAERLASGYAQGSSARPNPGQADFEAWLSEVLREPRSYDYAGWLRALDAALGAENVCPLLLEESNTLSFWQTLEDFAGLEAPEPAAMVRGEGNQNRRSAGADQWTISASDAHAKAKVAVDKPLNLLLRNTPDLGHRFHAIWDGHSG